MKEIVDPTANIKNTETFSALFKLLVCLIVCFATRNLSIGFEEAPDPIIFIRVVRFIYEVLGYLLLGVAITSGYNAMRFALLIVNRVAKV